MNPKFFTYGWKSPSPSIFNWLFGFPPPSWMKKSLSHESGELSLRVVHRVKKSCETSIFSRKLGVPFWWELLPFWVNFWRKFDPCIFHSPVGAPSPFMVIEKFPNTRTDVLFIEVSYNNKPPTLATNHCQSVFQLESWGSARNKKDLPKEWFLSPLKAQI